MQTKHANRWRTESFQETLNINQKKKKKTGEK